MICPKHSHQAYHTACFCHPTHECGDCCVERSVGHTELERLRSCIAELKSLVVGEYFVCDHHAIVGGYESCCGCSADGECTEAKLPRIDAILKKYGLV